MTVTIKKSGIEDFKPFEVTCGNCDSVLEVSDLSDVKVTEHPGQGEMGGSTSLTIVCVACGNVVNVPAKLKESIIKMKKITRR